MCSIRKKIVTVGDSSSGKTCLLIAITKKKFQPQLYSSSFTNYETKVDLGDGRSVGIEFLDVNCSEEFNRLRPFAYPKTDFIMMCFSAVDAASFDSITERWLLEIKSFCPTVPIILIATKTDLREDPDTVSILKKRNEKPISTQKGQKLAKKINAIAYIECSAVDMKGIEDILHLTTPTTPTTPKRNSQGCFPVPAKK